MNILKTFYNWLVSMGRVAANEFAIIIRDPGVLLFFFALPLAYPVVYTLIYNPEVVRKMPIAVVDNSRTPSSRELVRKAEACPAIQIYAYTDDMAQARELMNAEEVYAVLQIPADFDKKIKRGEQATTPFYANMSLLLRFRAFVSALSDLQLALASEITLERVNTSPVSAIAAGRDVSLPVRSESHFLGDSEQGFASFVIPGIVILILQQSMILGITLLGGTSRDRRRRDPLGQDPLEVRAGITATVLGRSLVYTLLYFPLTIYILHYIPWMFNLPHYGSAVDYLLFIFPLLLSTSFLGQALNVAMKERESAFIIIVFTSVVFLFLSGLTWPRYAMSSLWTWVGNLVPATWGVEGFIRINSNAATLGESARPFHALWILSAVYMLAAFWSLAYLRTPSKKKEYANH